MTAPSPRPAAPDTTGELREAIRDELGGWPLGGGYYQYTVGSDEAGDMTDAILALPALRDLLAERDTLAATVRDSRNPQQCPRCGHWCVYDGWDHVHGNGIGIGSCALAGTDR